MSTNDVMNVDFNETPLPSTPIAKDSSVDPSNLNGSLNSMLKKKSKKFFHFQQIAKHFEIPEAVAAQHLGISKTQLKKLCREHNIPRWPYRRLKSIQSKIDVLKCQLEKNTNQDEVSTFKKQIEELQQKKEFIKQNPKSIIQPDNLEGSANSGQTNSASDSPLQNFLTTTTIGPTTQFSGTSRPVANQAVLPPQNMNFNFTVTPSPTDLDLGKQDYMYDTDSSDSSCDQSSWFSPQNRTPKRTHRGLHIATTSDPSGLRHSNKPTIHRRTQSDIIGGDKYHTDRLKSLADSGGIQKRTSTQLFQYHYPSNNGNSNENKRRRIYVPELFNPHKMAGSSQSFIDHQVTPSSIVSTPFSRMTLSADTPGDNIFADSSGYTLPSFASLLQQIGPDASNVHNRKQL
jgi:hypothetical protein